MEIRDAFPGAKGSKKAPGPDGIPREVVTRSGRITADCWARIFTLFLKKNCFPTKWKKARIILIPKKKGDREDLRIYRPICLIPEITKVFERILNNRIVAHLDNTGGLSDAQYGFRRNHSTVDAIMEVKSRTETATASRQITVAVTFYICNAFNSIPWKYIKSALVDGEFPLYLRGILHSYLNQRHIVYI